MLVKLTNGELVDFFDAMKQISEIEKNKKWFTYAITLNEENLHSKVVAVLNCGIPSKEYASYESAREWLIQKYAERDDDGNYVVDRTTNLIKIQDKYVEEAKREFNELNEANSDIIEKRNSDLKDYYEILKKEIEVDVEQTSLENFPDNINKIMLRALKPMIKIEE